MGLVEQSIVVALQRTGYVVLPGYGRERLDELRIEHAEAMTRLVSYDYPFGEQRRAELSDAYSQFPVTTGLLAEGGIGALCEEYAPDRSGDLLVWSEEWIRDESAIYGLPHFDRRHQLKVFVYLDDVCQAQGPTHVLNEPVERSHRRWIDAWRASLELTHEIDARRVKALVRDTADGSPPYKSVQCEVNMPRRDFRPLTGDAGSVVIFDTSLPHFGGLIEEGRRRTVRRHCLID